jgi:FK506-binding nuclear protein
MAQLPRQRTDLPSSTPCFAAAESEDDEGEESEEEAPKQKQPQKQQKQPQQQQKQPQDQPKQQQQKQQQQAPQAGDKRKAAQAAAEPASKKTATAAPASTAGKTPAKGAAQQQAAAKTPQAGKQQEQQQTPSSAAAKRVKPRVFENGFEIHDLKMGQPDGRVARPGKRVLMRYIGRLKKNGKVFDQNLKGKPFAFRLGVGEVIKGWVSASLWGRGRRLLPGMVVAQAERLGFAQLGWRFTGPCSDLP